MTLLGGFEPGATEVTVWSLEMTDPGSLRPSPKPACTPTLMHARRPAPELSRFFYAEVGTPWHWVDRAHWTHEQWMSWVDRPEHTLVTCWVDGTPAGYFELDRQGDSTEIAYFGLMPGFIGQGLGGWLLTEAIRHAWQEPGTRRVWVHTCSLDGPAALSNYQGRGLSVFDRSIEWRRLD